MLLGYVRVSTNAQETENQRNELVKAGVERFFDEHGSGSRRDRPELVRMLDELRPDDVVVVWKLDRLTRSVPDMHWILEQIKAKGAYFRSLTEAIETDKPGGQMVLNMLASFAQYERDLIRERTMAGLQRARREGRIGGRRPKLSPTQELEIARNVSNGTWSAQHAAQLFGLARSSVYRIKDKHGAETTKPPPLPPAPAPVAPRPPPLVSRPSPLRPRAAQPSPPTDIDRAASIEAAARSLIDVGLGVGDDMVYICDVVRRTGASRDELLALHRDSRIHLVEAEYPEALPNDKLQASTIEFRQARFVFVRLHPALF